MQAARVLLEEWHAPEPPGERTLVWLPGRPRAAFGAVTLSMMLHLGLALAAVSLMPAWTAPEAERGGEPVLDVLMIGSEEAEAIIEGARPEPVSLVPEATIEPEKATTPEPAPLSPEPARTMPEAAPEPLPPPVAEEPAQLVSPELPPQPAVEPTPLRSERPPVAEKPVAQEPSPRPVARKAEMVRQPAPPHAPSEARGRKGEGRATVNRVAQSRGGTGGQADVAGKAALTSFRSRLVAHLNRYKSYPEQAQERGLTGRNAVTLTLSREGRVLSAALSGPSGHALLDSATLAAVKRAQPFPAIPEGGPSSLTVTIGLNYQLQ